MKPFVPGCRRPCSTSPNAGFAAPLHSLANKEYEDLCRGQILDADNPVMAAFFHREALERVVERALAKTTSNAEESQFRVNNQAFALLLLATWTRRFDITV